MTRRAVPGDLRPPVGELWRRARRAFTLVWRAYPLGVLGAAGAAVVAGLSPVLAALLLRDVLDAITGQAGARRVIPPALGLAVLGLISVAVPHVSDYLAGQLRRRLQVSTAQELFHAIANWPGLARFENPQFYDRLRLGQQAGESAPSSLISAILIGIQSAVSVVGFLVTLVIVNPLIALLVVLAILPAIPVNLGLARAQAHTDWWNSPGRRRVQLFGSLLSEVTAAKEIRLFRTADFLRDRMLRDLRRVNETERGIESRALRHNLGLAALGAVVAGGGLVWAAVAAADGTLSVGDLGAVIVALGGAETALGTVVLQLAQLHQFLLNFGHYLDIVSQPPDLDQAAAPRPAGPLREAVRLEDVWFRYDAQLPWVVRGVTLTIPAGTSTGLVGLNGAGKSTIVKLLCRFYDPERGRITWDGTDIRELDLAQLRERITALFQDFVCYELTAAENIGLGDLSALEERARLAEAARAAGAGTFIDALPRGMDTLLSRVLAPDTDVDDPEIGTTLSGGQWQRLAIARAAVRTGRDLMILDEPTSGLDPRAEQDVVAEVRRQRAGATAVIISHRLGTIREVDHIVVIEDGQVVEEGDHAALMERGGCYADLFTQQAADYRDRD